MNAIEFKRVCKRFATTVALDELSLTVPLGQTTVLMGPSGGGKTTILRMLLGLETPDGGVIHGLEGLRPAAVFQEDRLCENLTVLGNAALPHSGLPPVQRREAHRKVALLLEAVGLGDCVDRAVRDLSGGMKRRIAIVRAVLAESDLVVFDEPLKGLDHATKNTTMRAIGPHVTGKTIVWVTHDEGDLDYFPGAHVVRI